MAIRYSSRPGSRVRCFSASRREVPGSVTVSETQVACMPGSSWMMATSAAPPESHATWANVTATSTALAARSFIRSQANPGGGRGSLPGLGHPVAGRGHHRHLGPFAQGQAVALRLRLGDGDDVPAAQGEEAL